MTFKKLLNGDFNWSADAVCQQKSRHDYLLKKSVSKIRMCDIKKSITSHNRVVNTVKESEAK